jgi:hypothetical protein
VQALAQHVAHRAVIVELELEPCPERGDEAFAVSRRRAEHGPRQGEGPVAGQAELGQQVSRQRPQRGRDMEQQRGELEGDQRVVDRRSGAIGDTDRRRDQLLEGRPAAGSIHGLHPGIAAVGEQLLLFDRLGSDQPQEHEVDRVAADVPRRRRTAVDGDCHGCIPNGEGAAEARAPDLVRSGQPGEGLLDATSRGGSPSGTQSVRFVLAAAGPAHLRRSLAFPRVPWLDGTRRAEPGQTWCRGRWVHSRSR